jgi:SAM-dependent methyltransferase
MKNSILDLGCGRNKIDSAIGLDLHPQKGVDVVADLKKPLPFKTSSFDLVRASHVVEHLPDICSFLAEVHRVLKPGGRICILTPHYSTAGSYRDPTHVHHLAVKSFDYFCGLAGEDFLPVNYRFEMLQRRIIFGRKAHLGIEAWANRHPDLYEQHFAMLLPALEIEIWMKAVKKTD